MSGQAPRVLGRAFGLSPEHNPAAPLIARLFGARNVALGIRLLRAEGEELDYWLRASVLMDAFDGLAVLAARARGYAPTRTARPPGRSGAGRGRDGRGRSAALTADAVTAACAHEERIRPAAARAIVQ